jgi:hypothetical protein
MAVAKALESMKTENVGNNPQALRIALERRFDIDDVKSISSRDVEITREGDDWVVRAAWDVTTDFVANVGFIVSFDKTVQVPTS